LQILKSDLWVNSVEKKTKKNMNKNLLRIYNKKFNDIFSEKKNQNNSSTFPLATMKVFFVPFDFEDPVHSFKKTHRRYVSREKITLIT